MKIKLTEVQSASPMNPSTAQLGPMALRKVHVSESSSKLTAPCAVMAARPPVKDYIGQDIANTIIDKGNILQIPVSHIDANRTRRHYQNALTSWYTQRRAADRDRSVPIASLSCVAKDITASKLNIGTQKSLRERVLGFAVNPASSDLSSASDSNELESLSSIIVIDTTISKLLNATLQQA